MTKMKEFNVNGAAVKAYPLPAAQRMHNYTVKYACPQVLNIGTGLYVAKGIIAIGNFSFGLVSLGIISLGLLSLGAFSLGLISFGAISIGILLALGSISAGFISLGACAFGYLSIGACAIGNYSLGAYAYGATLSYGAKAEGGLAFSTENGAITFTKEYIKMMIEMHLKDIPTIIKNIFINLGN